MPLTSVSTPPGDPVADPGGKHLSAPLPLDPSVDVLALAFTLADRLDGDGAGPITIDLDSVAAGMQAVRSRGGARAQKIYDAERAVEAAAEGEIAARRSEFGSQSALLIAPRAHITGLRKVDELVEAFEAERNKIALNPDLSDSGRKKKFDALQQAHVKEVDAAITESEALVDRHILGRRARLEKLFIAKPAPEVSIEERTRREVQAQCFLTAHAHLALTEFRVVVSDLVNARSVLAGTALRALCYRAAGVPGDLRAFVASLQGEAHAIAIEHVLADPDRCQAAVEWSALSKAASRMSAESAAVRKTPSGARTLLHGWEKGTSTVNPIPGAR